MKEGWEYKELGKCCEKTTNINWNNSFSEIAYNYIDLSSVDRESHTITKPQIINKTNAPSRAKQIVKSGDVIFATTRPTLRRFCLINADYNNQICSTGFCVLRPHKTLLPNWIFYNLMCDDFYRYIEPLQKGANYPAVTDKIVKQFQIPIPALAEQQQIVSFLDSEFEKIDALKANAETQLQAAKDLFQKALKEMLTPKDGWEEKKFGSVCFYNKVQGKWENMRYIGLEHIEPHTSNLLSTISVNDVESSTFKFDKGDVLYGRLRPYLQKVIIAPFDGCCSTEIFPIKSKEIKNSFLKYWLLSDKITGIMNESCSGCRMPRANMNDFKNVIIQYPQSEEQQRIADHLDTLSAKVKQPEKNYNETITLCNDLKQSLLKRIFE